MRTMPFSHTRSMESAPPSRSPDSSFDPNCVRSGRLQLQICGCRLSGVASILVAASPEPRAILERILAGHELACAETMAQGEQLLRERAFDLIICTIVF